MSYYDSQKLFLRKAKEIPNWQSDTIFSLANNYVKYEYVDPNLADSYLSAIMLRYWYTLFKYHRKDQKFDVDTYLYILTDAVLKALNQRAWLDPSTSLYNNVNGPNTAINLHIKQGFCKLKYLSEMSNRKLNDNWDTLSLDYEYEVDNDNETLMGQLAHFSDEVGGYSYKISYCQDIAQNYINKGELDKAIVIDIILNQSKVHSSKAFSTEVMDDIENINSNYLDEFKKTYERVNDKELKKAADKMVKMAKIKSYSNDRRYYLSKYIQRLKKELRETVDRDLLCC